MTTVGANCQRDVVTVTSQATVAEAARLMRDKHVGCVVVVDDQRSGPHIPLGIVTDRDIVLGVVAPELNAGALTVGDIMGPELVTAGESEDVFDAVERMRNKGVRRMPIVQEDGTLIGIVSIDDVIEVLAEEMNSLARLISREQLHEQQMRR